MIELSLYRTPRGGRSIRKYHTGLFHHIHTASPKYIEVHCPPDLKNTNSQQCDSNRNIQSFPTKQGDLLYKLLRCSFYARGDHVTETALFLREYPDNKWRVC